MASALWKRLRFEEINMPVDQPHRGISGSLTANLDRQQPSEVTGDLSRWPGLIRERESGLACTYECRDLCWG